MGSKKDDVLVEEMAAYLDEKTADLMVYCWADWKVEKRAE